MFHMFRGLIFISITGNAVPLHFQTVLNDFWAISNYNRGGHACISIPTTMQNMSKKEKTNYKGVFYFFMYMYFKLFNY
jgi:hypothetical protein